jgi:hypothetical protein
MMGAAGGLGAVRREAFNSGATPPPNPPPSRRRAREFNGALLFVMVKAALEKLNLSRRRFTAVFI